MAIRRKGVWIHDKSLVDILDRHSMGSSKQPGAHIQARSTPQRMAISKYFPNPYFCELIYIRLKYISTEADTAQ